MYDDEDEFFPDIVNIYDDDSEGGSIAEYYITNSSSVGFVSGYNDLKKGLTCRLKFDKFPYIESVFDITNSI